MGRLFSKAQPSLAADKQVPLSAHPALYSVILGLGWVGDLINVKVELHKQGLWRTGQSFCAVNAVSETGRTSESCTRPRGCVWVSEKEREREKKSPSLQKGEKISLSPNVSVFFFFLLVWEKRKKNIPQQSETSLFLTISCRLDCDRSLLRSADRF